MSELWFDVGKQQNTTYPKFYQRVGSCGLMQENNRIQQTNGLLLTNKGCGLMQENNRIQQ